MTIPVSCVEAGRWRTRSRAFAAAPRAQYATGRAKRIAQVTLSMAGTGERFSDQAAVWADIAMKSVHLDAPSDTAAMEAIFHQHAALIDEFVAALQPVPGQVGALSTQSLRTSSYAPCDLLTAIASTGSSISGRALACTSFLARSIARAASRR